MTLENTLETTEPLEGVVMTTPPPAQSEVNAAFTPGTALVPRGGWGTVARRTCWCGAPLPRGRRTFCSDEHARLDPTRREATTCQLPECGKPLPKGRRRFCSTEHAKRQRATDQRIARAADGGLSSIKAAARLLHGTVDRSGMVDVTTLETLWNMQLDVEAATYNAIAGLRAHGFTWEEIGRAMGGTSKQAAKQWFDRHTRLFHPAAPDGE